MEAYHWIAVAMLVLIMACSGCSSARPYTRSERTALAHALVGQSLDVVTTDAALQSGQMREANPIWGDPDNAMPILIGKAAVLGLVWLYCEWRPQDRKSVWTILGVFGYGAAAWNTYQMIDNDVNPWGE